MNKATITTPEGAPIEVDFEAIKLPEGFSISSGEQKIPDGYVKQEVFDASVKTRLERQKNSLMKDEGYVRSILEANLPGLEFGEDGKPVLPKPSKEVDIDALRKQVEAELVAPVKTELEKLMGSNAKLLEAKRRSEIMQAAINHGVQEHLLKPASSAAGAPSFWENMVAGQYGYADEYGVFAVKNGDGFALNPSGTGEAPLLDIDSHIASLKKNPAYAQFFKIEGQKGSGFKQDGGSIVGGQVTRDAFSNGQLSAEQLEGIASGKLKVAT